MTPDDVEATSILTLRTTGVLDGQPFTLVGRRCFRGRRGNLWNEWTLSNVPHFLSEFAGSFTLYREGALLEPADRDVALGGRLPWIVVERGTATRVAEWGEVEPGPETYEFFDLSSAASPPRRASIAEGRTFIGEAIDPKRLDLAVSQAPPRLVPVPNTSPPSGVEAVLNVGDRGDIAGVIYHVLGIVARTHEADHWQEYCLYSAGIGLRWLVVADGHWSWVKPIEAGAAPAMSGLPTFSIVEWASGELPWAVHIGEGAFQVETGDLTMERTASEVSWSRSTKLKPDAIAQAFGKRVLPRPR